MVLKLMNALGKESLLEALSHDDYEVQEAAAWILGQMKELSAVNALVRKLDARDTAVQNMSAWALKEITAKLQKKTSQFES